DFAMVRYNSDGSLDSHFGNGGKVFTDFAGRDDSASSIAIQANGKIVVAGGAGLDAPPYEVFALARYTSDGSLDTAFGTGGKVTTDFGSSFGSFAGGMTLQADGKIVVVGSSYQSGTGSDFALARYEGLGAVDAAILKINDI